MGEQRRAARLAERGSGREVRVAEGTVAGGGGVAAGRRGHHFLRAQLQMAQEGVELGAAHLPEAAPGGAVAARRGAGGAVELGAQQREDGGARQQGGGGGEEVAAV